MGKKTNFSINKTYLDCIDKNGNCFIFYLAHLEISFIKINYSGLIFSDIDGKTIEKSSFLKFNPPIIEDNLFSTNAHLKVLGNWERLTPPTSFLLYRDNDGNEVFWDCHHPKAFTKIEYNHTIYKGLGYAETLFLPIKPWKLPIDELRWGRYLSEATTIIWIHWKNQYPVNKLFYNGIWYEDAKFEENQLWFNQQKHRLVFELPVIIRKGKLSGIIAKVPWLKLLFSHKILNTIEIKYKSKTTLYIDSIASDKGWSLYEIVTWHK